MTTIDDVARRAGVSTATVSRALRGLNNVREQTRLAVVAAAAELDYVVSPSAASLATGRTRAVAVVTPYPSRWFYAQALAGAENAVREQGFGLLLYGVPNPEARARFFAELPLRKRVDAVLVLCLDLSAAEEEALRGLEVPVGLVGSRRTGMASVCIDDEAGAHTAVSHLIGLGHRRIGFMGGERSEPMPFATSATRRSGARRALAEVGLDLVSELDVDGEFTIGGGERAMTRLLSLPYPPSAVFAASDEMAFGALTVLRRAGLRVPRDMSVVGFDDHELAGVLDLTTIAQPVAEQGASLGRMLLDALAGSPDALLATTAALHLVVRRSTGVPRAWGVAARGDRAERGR